jgi:hypothetical protein
MVEEKFELSEYPAINLAYPFACDAYEWAAKRWDAMDSRIHTILGLGMSLTLAAPAVFSVLKLNPCRDWLIAAACSFTLALGFGIYARQKGALTILNPRMLYQKWLHFSELEFKKNLIFFAGEHLDKNKNLLIIKDRLLMVVTVMFFLEAVCLVASVSFRP